MAEKRTELLVAALCNGTAIDHIPTTEVFKVVSLLNLDKIDRPITIGNKLESRKMSMKGIIKISDHFFEEEELNKIAVIAPNVVLNIIKNYEVVEKRKVELPSVVKGIVRCNNPKCITNNEPMVTRFNVTDPAKIELQCYYCGVKIQKDDIELK